MEKAFKKMVENIAFLRGEKGCPWDRKQTIESLKEDLLSEAQEVAEAIDKKDYENLCEELGDVIWAALLIAQAAKEEKRFDVKEILDLANDKIVRRHPWVFAGLEVKDAEEALKLWKKIKVKEKKAKHKKAKQTKKKKVKKVKKAAKKKKN